MPDPQLKSWPPRAASLDDFLLVCLLELLGGGELLPPPTSYVWPRDWPIRPRTMTMQKLVSGRRLFTISPRFKVLESLQRASLAQEILRSLSDATQPTRFAFIKGAAGRAASCIGHIPQGHIKKYKQTP